jgi:hypothetical protein
VSQVVVHRRSLAGGRCGRAIGASVVGRHVAEGVTACDCCEPTHWVSPGDLVLDVVTRGDRRLVVCIDCGPTPATPSEPVRLVLETLSRIGRPPRRSGDGWTARCPVHDWRWPSDDWRSPSPSLSVRGSPRGEALVRCRAGCRLADVLDALGLTWRDLFPRAAHR